MSKLWKIVVIGLGLILTGASALKDALVVTVRPTEIDVKGHVNNAKFIEYLQWGRWDWLDRQGLTNERLLDMGAVLVVANININYRREVKMGDTVKVETYPISISDKSFIVKQIIVRGDNEVVADAEVVMVAIDPSVRKSRMLPDDLVNFLRKTIREKPESPKPRKAA